MTCNLTCKSESVSKEKVKNNVFVSSVNVVIIIIGRPHGLQHNYGSIKLLYTQLCTHSNYGILTCLFEVMLYTRKIFLKRQVHMKYHSFVLLVHLKNTFKFVLYKSAHRSSINCEGYRVCDSAAGINQ